jgi:predicted DsbA family dithiol-disulfide isomerase
LGVLVEIYSDVVCPWCAIGKARFEKALDTLDADRRARVEVIWRPHQLDPSAPSVGRPVFEGYAKKFGGPDRAAQIIDNVTSVAAAEGITFHMDRALRANTLDCHRLIGLALHQGGSVLQHAVKQRLLDAYFSDGLDVGDRLTLARLTADVGLFESTDQGAAFLESTELVDETRREILDGMENGVTAVPTFVFDGQWSIPGAQDTEVFVKVLERIFAMEDAERNAPTVVAGETCAVGDESC